MPPTIFLGKRKKRDKTVNAKIFQSWYNNKRWRNLRDYKRSQNSLCELCEAKGITRQVAEIHHIKHININNPNEEDIYDYTNLMSVCIPCHRKIHHAFNTEKKSKR